MEPQVSVDHANLHGLDMPSTEMHGDGLPDHIPPPRRMSVVLQYKQIQKQVRERIDEGVREPSKSPQVQPEAQAAQKDHVSPLNALQAARVESLQKKKFSQISYVSMALMMRIRREKEAAKKAAKYPGQPEQKKELELLKEVLIPPNIRAQLERQRRLRAKQAAFGQETCLGKPLQSPSAREQASLRCPPSKSKPGQKRHPLPTSRPVRPAKHSAHTGGSRIRRARDRARQDPPKRESAQAESTST